MAQKASAPRTIATQHRRRCRLDCGQGHLHCNARLYRCHHALHASQRFLE